MRISLLDRANTRTGQDDASALRAVVERAVHAESLGFHRFLVAEHHGVPGIAGSAPTVLAAAVGQATSTIRVGTAGIMLPDHVPFVVAEQVAVLASLFPGRVDIGIGSSVGFTPAVRRALRQDEDATVARDGYLTALDDVLGYVRGSAAGTAVTEVTMRPQLQDAAGELGGQEELRGLGLFLLSGGSPETLEAAAERGLGVILGGPSVTGESREIQTLADGASPVASVPVAVAATREAARDLVLPEVWAKVLSRSTGSFEPLRPVGELDERELTAQQRRRIDRELANTVYGTPDEVEAELTGLKERGFTEVLATGGMSDPGGQRTSDGLLAGVVGRLRDK
ncbi:MAG TPA: MsnO8 family LLM class oxidoreductase [Candidatus Corynebacterium avicola]|uniref:MsnO8 family LLM class oxidoreductase n=1 Tax=Candidatus Corynebacterium avicola TaxID=2838527 RepID=A0A9D1RM69_9CORY|nr:MsnO8 family LLM class oxidoreductase [Candidatus Corynebacterium avicola]